MEGKENNNNINDKEKYNIEKFKEEIEKLKNADKDRKKEDIQERKRMFMNTVGIKEKNHNNEDKEVNDKWPRRKTLRSGNKGWVWLDEFYGISTIVGYLTPNPFLCK